MQNASTKVTLCSHTAGTAVFRYAVTVQLFVAATNGNSKTITDWNTYTKCTDCDWAKSL